MRPLADRIVPLAKAVLAEDRRGDVVSAAGLLVVALALDALGLVRTFWSGPSGVSSWWFVVPAVVGCTALVWRRSRPLGVLGAATVAFAADVALGGSVGLLVILWEALYAVHLHGGRAARRVTTVGVAIVSLALMIVVGEITGEVRYAILAGVQAVALLVMPMWWGANVRQGRELTAAAHERGRLERERSTALLRLAEVARHDAVRAERTAVARDLHDVVASHLSAITITSGAALAGAAEPERDRAALRSIREESLASLRDMQAMIRVLSAGTGSAASGEDGTDLLAAPRVAQLEPVLEQVRLAGLDLAVTDPDGVLTGDTVVPAAVDHAVYRVVREALTNVLKHGGARAVLRLAAGVRVEIEVYDDGRRPGGAARDVADVGGGTELGLVSMRERVESIGGSFEAGPAAPDAAPDAASDAAPGGVEPAGGASGVGWRVRAVLPLPDRATAEPASSGRTIPGVRA